MTRIRPDMAAPRPRWLMPEPRDVEVGGHRIRYWEKGEGRPIVLVHGFSGSATFEWGRVFDTLSAQLRVIALQVLGFAPSAQPDITYSTDALAASLGGFLEALGLKDVVLLGESFGGWLVGSYAVRAAQLGLPPIARLVIVGGPVGRLSVNRPEPSGFVHQAVMQEVADLFRHTPIVDNEPFKRRIAEDSGLRKAELSLGAVATIATPTLLLWGEMDALIPLSVGEAALEAMPDARMVVFEDIGHIPSVECPAEFCQAVLAFSADRPARG
jgi:pimeloyl-ACP methyl ester carboxylesterase